MKLLSVSIHGLHLFKEGLNIDFTARQRVTDNSNSGLTRLFGNNYKQDVLGIIGINASGKTTALRWLCFVLDIYLKQGKVNDEEYETLLSKQHVRIEAYFTDLKFVYKINSEIIPDKDGEYIFKEEIIWRKKAIKSMSKNRLFEFGNSQIILKRSEEQSLFLSENMSIMLSQFNDKIDVMDLLSDTNFNIMRVLSDVPATLIQYLDESIEYVNNEFTTKEYTRLKFKNQDEEILIYNPMELYQYLSSGTIRGLNVFAAIQMAFKSGGFVLIDEIENHFNGTIVQTILGLFKHPEINVNGATLIFTTHYAELLDEFDRTDSIYIALKEKTLTLRNLNDLLLRNDYKKSEVYQSSYVGRTAPSYDAYLQLKKFFLGYGKEIEKQEAPVDD